MSTSLLLAAAAGAILFLGHCRFTKRVGTVPYAGEESLLARLKVPIEYGKYPVKYFVETRKKVGDVFYVNWRHLRNTLLQMMPAQFWKYTSLGSLGLRSQRELSELVRTFAEEEERRLTYTWSKSSFSVLRRFRWEIPSTYCRNGGGDHLRRPNESRPRYNPLGYFTLQRKEKRSHFWRLAIERQEDYIQVA